TGWHRALAPFAAGMLSHDVRLRRARSVHPLRHDRAPAIVRRRIAATAAVGRPVRDAGRGARLARAVLRRLSMPFDAGSYLRLDAPQCIGTTSAGASFATSTGDILEVSCFGAGIFRLRMGPQTRA